MVGLAHGEEIISMKRIFIQSSTTHSLTDLAVQKGLNTSIQSEWASAATEI